MTDTPETTAAPSLDFSTVEARMLTHYLDLTPDQALADDRERWETEVVLEAFVAFIKSDAGYASKSLTEVITELREGFFPPVFAEGTVLASILTSRAVQAPAVPIDQSVTPEHIVCLEDGKKLQSMKRYLATQHGLTPEEYRAKWGLPADYPMVAPNYAAKRAEIAKAQGLGKKVKLVPPAPLASAPQPEAPTSETPTPAPVAAAVPVSADELPDAPTAAAAA